MGPTMNQPGITSSKSLSASPQWFYAGAGVSELNHAAGDQPVYRFSFASYGTPNWPAAYFSADGGFYTGAHLTVCNVNSTSTAQGASYVGDQVIYYPPLCWNRELANHGNHPASSTPGYTPIGTYMSGFQNDVNGPTILSAQYGTNGGTNPQGAMFLGCATDASNIYAKFAMAHDWPAGNGSTNNHWFYIGNVNLTTVCLDQARGPGISATNLDDAFDIALGRSAAQVMALKGNGANGAAIEFREYNNATPTTDAAAPSDGRCVLYCRDNGAGKEQLCVRFNTGAVQVLATEP